MIGLVLNQMIMSVVIEKLVAHFDQRGMVFEPLEPNGFKVQQNAHVVVSFPGTVRGNHYHQHGTEIIAVVGPALVLIRNQSLLSSSPFTSP